MPDSKLFGWTNMETSPGHPGNIINWVNICVCTSHSAGLSETDGWALQGNALLAGGGEQCWDAGMARLPLLAAGSRANAGQINRGTHPFCPEAGERGEQNSSLVAAAAASLFLSSHFINPSSLPPLYTHTHTESIFSHHFSAYTEIHAVSVCALCGWVFKMWGI